MREILFLCTGNYYRSRYAEAWFNHAAARRGLAWRAFSRGLAVHLAPPRGLSPHAVLRLRGWRMPGGLTAADPAQVTAADLERATRIVALKEAEHRPLLAQLHPAWEKRIEYWAIDDLDSAPSAVALDAIEARVNSLLEELADGDAPAAGQPRS